MQPPARVASALVTAAVLIGGCAIPGAVAPTPVPTPLATIAPSVAPGSLEPVPTPPPEPTPTPDPAVIGLAVTGCPGGTVLEWTPSTHHNFHHYTALRSPSDRIEPDFPPIAPAVDWGRTYTTDRFTTSAVDASVLPSRTEWNYRVMAYDILNDPVSVSPVRSATIGAVLDLGDLTASTTDGVTVLAWPAYAGPDGCLSSYRVMAGIGRPPSTVVSDQSRPTIETDALHAGTTYQLRVDAVRVTPLGSFVTARSGTLVYTVP